MKMKHCMRRFFNMIEVSLAMGVTAVGVLGAVTILPIALKTTNSTTYNAYLSDAANMVFMGIDEFLNEECYYIKYEDEHKSGATAEDIQKVNEERREAFSEIFDTNMEAAKILNEELGKRIISGTSTGVHVIHEIKDDHGFFAFYPEDPNLGAISLPDKYSDRLEGDIGRPIFSARYRIVVTELENDADNKMDGLRRLVEVQTEMTTKEWVDPRTGKKQKVTVPGARVAGTQRCDLDEEEKKLMKRIYIEFSWPVQAEYKSRNKETFVKEYYMVD